MSFNILRRLRTALALVWVASFGAFFLPKQWEWLATPLLVLFIACPIPLLLLVRRVRRLESPGPSQNGTTDRGLRFVAIVAAALALIDAFFLGQGLVAIILCAVAILYLLPRAIAARSSPPLLRLRLAKAALTLAAGALAFGIIQANNALAHRRAEQVVAAIEKYRAKNSRYPERLEHIVPEFLAEIPPPKYMVGQPGFRYLVAPESHGLMYVDFPPFGRRVYTFERREWSALD